MGVRGSTWASVFIVGPGGPEGVKEPCPGDEQAAPTSSDTRNQWSDRIVLVDCGIFLTDKTDFVKSIVELCPEAQGKFIKRFGSLVGGHGGSELRIDDVLRSWRSENRWWSCILVCSVGFA